MRRKDRFVTPTMWHSTSGRPRVLIEHRDPAISRAVSDLLLDAGFDTANCDGPDGPLRCPLVHDNICPRVEEADLVIFGLELPDEDDRAVLASLKQHAGGRPIVVEASPLRAKLYSGEVDGCAVVPRPMNRSSLLDAIGRLLG